MVGGRLVAGGELVVVVAGGFVVVSSEVGNTVGLGVVAWVSSVSVMAGVGIDRVMEQLARAGIRSSTMQQGRAKGPGQAGLNVWSCGWFHIRLTRSIAFRYASFYHAVDEGGC